MMAAGLICAADTSLRTADMSAYRTTSAIPFGGKYRLIDFSLSAFVNAGITKVGVVTDIKSRSLMDHIGSGKDWDLARHSGGVIFIPSYHRGEEDKSSIYTGVEDYIGRCRENNIVIADGNSVFNPDLRSMLTYHEKTDADITRASDRYGCSIGLMIVKREILLKLSEAECHSFFDISEALSSLIAVSVEWRYEGCFFSPLKTDEYLKSNRALLRADVRMDLFGNPTRPIATKIRNTAPTKYGYTAETSDSIIADGCVIKGRVENSVIFRGVKIGEGSVVKDSVVMQNTVIDDDVYLNCVIVDKDSVIREGRRLSGHSSMPFYIGKGKTV